jgi:hypothetical protein
MRLRWTRRLWDYLAKEDWYVEECSLKYFREVELECDEDVSLGISTDQQSPQKQKLTTSVENGVTSDCQLSFDQFRQCYSRCRGSVCLATCKDAKTIATPLRSMSSLAPPECHKPLELLDNMAQSETGFFIVWISDTVFVSSIQFKISRHHGSLDEYRIFMSPRLSNDYLVYFVYSLPLVSKDPPQPRLAPPIAPISFLGSMVNVLPFGYFKAISFFWYRYISEPPLKELLSLVPTPKPGVIPFEALTTLTFCSLLSRDQIHAVLSHCEENNLWVQPKFSVQGSTFHEYNSALRESPHLRHIHIPLHYFRHQLERDEAPFTVNEHLESMTIDYFPHIYGADMWPSSSLLKVVSCCRNLKHLYMRVKGWKRFLNVNSSVLNWVISGAIPLEEVVVSSCVDPAPNFQSVWANLSLTLLGCFVAGQRNLCHFSIVAKHRKGSWPIPKFLKAPMNLEPWDKLVTPSLALNCFRKLQSGNTAKETRMHENSVAWKVRAVNLGVVYRKTTYHTPHDMSTANAGVLFALLRSQFCAKTA